ncbi:MAG: phosphate signaling complex protein PhoU [Isosphaeraceae bacterium]
MVWRKGNEGDEPGSAQTPAGRHFQRDMEALWGDVLKQAALVETALQSSIHALCHGRPDLAAAVRDGEPQINSNQVRIERECLKMLALHQPVATDLRRVAALLKINNELERMADLAEHIARRSLKLVGKPIPMAVLEHLDALGAEATELVRNGLDAMSRSDASLARSVIDSDRAIDRRSRLILKELKRAIRDEPERVTTWLRLINTSRNLERIADHATNIAEGVIYIREGDIYRRGDLEPARSPSRSPTAVAPGPGPDGTSGGDR